jgi:hypothetical protein
MKKNVRVKQMLSNEQVELYNKWIGESDSVMDAHGLIYDNLGRQLTEEELAQLTNYRKNRADGAQIEVSCRTLEDATAPTGAVIIDPKNSITLPVKNKVARMQELATQIADTYRRKNADYGDSFGISVRKYGIIAALTRMSDKWNRLENLILNMNQERNVADESVLDTLLDMATYALMTYMEIERM